IRGKKLGEPVTLSGFRKDKNIQVKLNPAEWREPAPVVAKGKNSQAPVGEAKNIGVTVQILSAELAEKFCVTVAEGVVVTTVENNSLAAKAGLNPVDVITAINQQAVLTPKQFNDTLKRADLKKGVLVNLVSGDTARFEILKQGE